MPSRNKGGVPPRLSRAAARFADWRRMRAVGTRIPESLWASAVTLAQTYGICRTALVLKLDYYGLKKRVAENGSPAEHARDSGQRPTFVEWPASTLAPPSECVIELENTAGERMRVHLKGISAPDLVALSGSLWKAPR